jgi:hypothetical protein
MAGVAFPRFRSFDLPRGDHGTAQIAAGEAGWTSFAPELVNALTSGNRQLPYLTSSMASEEAASGSARQ